MRIVDKTLSMFLSELKKEEELRHEVERLGQEYLKAKKHWGPQNWTTKSAREKLEWRLTAYKKHLSHIYDIMHDRGLSNFESGFIRPENRGKFFPLVESVSEHDEDDQLFIQLMNINPLVYGGRQVGKSPIRPRGDRVVIGPEGNGASASNDEQGSPDIQSTGDARVSPSLQEKEADVQLPRETPEVDVFDEHLLY